MVKNGLKHPIIFYIISFIAVVIAGIFKVMKFEAADLFLEITFYSSVITMVFVIFRIMKSRKNVQVYRESES